MNRTHIAVVLCAAVACTATACNGQQKVPFPAGTTMAQLTAAGRIDVGVKFDQPGLGFRNPATGRPEGFDIEMAEIVATGLGLDPDQVSYHEAVSADREHMIITGQVDIVIASYSITDQRRRTVGQAGPYYLTGQQILVREADKHAINDTLDDPAQLRRLTVCSVRGSTSIQQWQNIYNTAQPIESRTYTECVQRLLDKTVDAVTTDGAVLLGYAAQQPDKLEVVGEPFSQEGYGIGYRKGDHAFCAFLTDTIQAAIDNGEWKQAFTATLGEASPDLPTQPTPEPCPT
jgi:glutamate transport system substrate-binding protein